MADIEKILRKRKPTGKDIGILAITNSCIVSQQQQAGEEPKPIVSTEKLSGMIDSLPEYEADVYREYVAMYNWLVLQRSKAKGLYNSALISFMTIENSIIRANISEDTFAFSSNLPVVMTRSQYDKAAKNGIEAFLTDDKGNDLRSNVFMMIGSWLAYYLKQMGKQPQQPNPLQAIKEQYEHEPVKSDLILSSWNTVAEEGYYTIEDGSGRRSDRMTFEEWQQAVVTDKGREVDRIFRSDENEDEKIAIWNKWDAEENRIKMQGGSQEDIDRISVIKGLMLPTFFHIYDEPPEDLTKWDVLESGYLMQLYPIGIGFDDSHCERYGIIFSPQSSIEPDDYMKFTAAMEDFAAEFPELVTIALEEIQHKYFDGTGTDLPQLHISEWYSTTFTWRKLYDLDFYGIREEAHSDRYISGSTRISENGIAILRDEDIGKAASDNRIAEDGSYIEPQPMPSLPKYTLDAFLPTSPDHINAISNIDNSRDRLLDSLYSIEGYNIEIDIISKHYDISAMSAFKIDTAPIRKWISTLNQYASYLYRKISDTEYSDSFMKMNKLLTIQEHFKLIDCDKELIRSPENAGVAEEILCKNTRAFHGEYGTLLNYLMCVRGYSYNATDEGE